MANKLPAQIRYSFRLAKHNAERLEVMAERYGVTINSLMSMIVAQWLDTNYDLKDKVLQAITTEITNRLDNDDLQKALGTLNDEK